MSDYKALARVRDLTGRRIHLGWLEGVKGYLETDDTLTLAIDRVWLTETRDELRIKARGTTLYTWKLTDQGWLQVEPFTVRWSIAEVFTKRDQRVPDREWENLCHRPGTSRTPMDNLGRQAQGYELTTYSTEGR